MTQQEILEGNKLIAEFMGLYPKKSWTTLWMIDLKKCSYQFNDFITSLMEDEAWYITELKFNSSWNWLMPVVEKIESMGFWFNIKKNHVTVAWDNKGTCDSNMIHSEFGDLSKIERVYQCVVAFIKYNENKNK